MGFIGAGAILRKDNLVLGVTTAATLWFTTMMGLCFGGGQWGLGTAALILGLVTLWGLKIVEKAMRQDVHWAVCDSNTPHLKKKSARASIAKNAKSFLGAYLISIMASVAKFERKFSAEHCPAKPGPRDLSRN